MGLLQERLQDAHVWWRIADPDWADPLDPDFARRRGGRWNPPDSFPVLYVNEDLATARLNLRGFIARWPYEPEDLRDDRGPALVGCVLPRRQIVCDAHSAAGLRAAGLPDSYPLDSDGATVSHSRCRPSAARAQPVGLRGVVPARRGRGRRRPRLAWFPRPLAPARRSRTLASRRGSGCRPDGMSDTAPTLTGTAIALALTGCLWAPASHRSSRDRAAGVVESRDGVLQGQPAPVQRGVVVAAGSTVTTAGLARGMARSPRTSRAGSLRADRPVRGGDALSSRAHDG